MHGRARILKMYGLFAANIGVFVAGVVQEQRTTNSQLRGQEAHGQPASIGQ